MAEGRILSKRVSKSDKVASLSSDTARMFYCMIIPWLDVEGRLEANPRLMKGDIAPLLDHITKEEIERLLVELDKAGLIILYEVDNKKYLQLVKFDENQPNLRKDREKKSLIPKAPANKKQAPAELRQNSGETPAELPHKINISKDNIREAKATPAELPPVDNSEPVPDTPPEKDAFLKELIKTQKQVREYFPHFNFNLFYQNYKKYHPKAFIKTFESLITYRESVKSPYAYCEKIIKQEDMNFNEADHIAKSAEFKTPFDIVKWAENFGGMPAAAK